MKWDNEKSPDSKRDNLREMEETSPIRKNHGTDWFWKRDEIENEWEDRVCEAEDARDEAEAEADDYREQINSLEAEVSDLQEEVEKLKNLNSEAIPF